MHWFEFFEKKKKKEKEQTPCKRAHDASADTLFYLKHKGVDQRFEKSDRVANGLDFFAKRVGLFPLEAKPPEKVGETQKIHDGIGKKPSAAVGRGVRSRF